MNSLNKQYKLSCFKAYFLIIAFAFGVLIPQISYAGNPTIDEVKTWKANGDDASFQAWIGTISKKSHRNKLRRWWKKSKWSKIEKWIEGHGGSTPTGGGGSGSGSGSGSGGSGGSGAASSAGLDLSTAPLFISTAVEPNIYFIIDDSGSMSWNTMVGPEITAYNPSSGLPIIDGYQRAHYSTSLKNQYQVVPPVSLVPEAWMAKNTVANPSYYDTTANYTPWPGKDANGNALFTDADPTNVLANPNQSVTTATIDLTADEDYYYNSGLRIRKFYLPVFYDWVDTNDNDIVELSDSYTEVEIKSGNEALFFNGRSYQEELQNFANWFQYYRKREFAAKAIIGSVVNGATGARMGIDAINFGHVFDAASMTDPATKLALLKKIYALEMSGATPLREALQEVGEMFRGKTSNPSPILTSVEGGTCQQNFQILLTDGYWNGSSPGVGDTDSDDNTVFDGNANSTGLGNVDGGYYADGYKNTLADVAMYYYENDLAPTLADEVPKTAGIDEATQQHLVTYTIAFGLKGNLDPTVNPDDGNVVWPKINTNNDKIDDLVHAAYNGRGEYLNAAHPEELEASLNDIIANIAERSATASAVAINSAKLTTETVIYLAEFNTFRWQGEIYAKPIIDLVTGELGDSWAAGAELVKRDLATKPRQIITYDGLKGIPFQWNKLIATQKNDLGINPAGNTGTVAEAEARLDYIRGDRSNEKAGYNFRERSSLLGDVVNSGPVFVGAPSLSWPDTALFGSGNLYSKYKKDNKDREGLIYVGANDGMLHAFHEKDGKEVFAYIPNMLFSNDTKGGLHYLTDSNYTHKYYNDLTPTVSDVYYGTSWKTILVNGLRGGGRGVYALDVTNPAQLAEDKAGQMVLWEFTDTDDADLGFTYSKPQIALGNNGKWVAIFGNGYNNGGSGESALFILDIEAGTDGTWIATDYRKILTGSGTSADINGLSTPSLVDIDGNGTVDRAYAGDLKGQLWVFDLSSTDPLSWKKANASPLFTTIGNRPITAKPAVSKHPTVKDKTSNAPNILVYFGSGQYLEDADKTDTTLNHYYGVWDNKTFNKTSSNLVQQTYLNSYQFTTQDGTVNSARVLTDKPVDYAGSDQGWFFSLPDSGERSVTGAIVRFGAVFFNTFVPTSSACSAGGYGFKMAVSAETGGALKDPVVDTNKDGVVDKNDKASDGTNTATVAAVRQEGFLPEPVFIEHLSYTADTVSVVDDGSPPDTGRLSWQELLK